MVGRARFELATNWLKERQSEYRHLQNKHLRHMPPVILSARKRRNATTQFLYRTFYGTGGIICSEDDDMPKPKYDLDIVRQAIEERDEAIQNYEYLANEMIYNGNSISWWCSKAKRNGDALLECWKALNEAGIHADGNTTAADAIRKLANRKTAQ